MIDSLEQIRLPDSMCPTIPKNKVKIVEIEDDWFIRGPIPGKWICQAINLPGNYTPHVALAILHAMGFSRKSNNALLERFHLDRFGVKKDSTRRALERLQKARLIEYVKVGQKFKVTMLPIRPEPETKTGQ